jgi:hypothetical protein
MCGISYLELLMSISVVVTMAGIAVPSALDTMDHFRAAGAARFVAARLHQARSAAVARGADTAVRFSREGEGIGYTVYLDGNRNGVRADDILRGIDRPLQPAQRLSDHFSGVVFGTLPDLPPPDPSTAAPGGDPIRLGAADSVTFTALGTATPGSLYILSRGRRQYVVRILGETGRIRIMQFDAGRGQWFPL